MAVTKEDLREFNRFADEKLERGGADSIVELAGEWEAQRHEVQSSVTNGVSNLIDIDEDTLRALAAAFPDVQDEHKLRQALARRGGITTAQMLAKAAAAAEKGSQK